MNVLLPVTVITHDAHFFEAREIVVEIFENDYAIFKGFDTYSASKILEPMYPALTLRRAARSQCDVSPVVRVRRKPLCANDSCDHVAW